MVGLDIPVIPVEHQYIVTGTSGGFPASNPVDKLLSLLHAVKTRYRLFNFFICHFGEMRKIETQIVGIYQRAFLGYMSSEHTT